VGTAAIQLVREAGALSLVTAGSPEKISRCLSLGARGGWNRKDGPFAPWVAAMTGRKGVDIVLDCVGALYFEQNLESLAPDGKLIIIGTIGGSLAETVDLRYLMSKRLQISGSVLRSMPTERKIELTRKFAEFALPRFADGRLYPVIDSVYDWGDVSEAHGRMEAGLNVGKIVLRVGD
jgi:tumor protein p53-inducible protein 3